MNSSSRIIPEYHTNLSYAQGITLQQETLKSLKQNENAPERILFCEHTPVITLGRSGDGEHLKVSKEKLDLLGIEYLKVARGGDITYHGNGQWTVYPILRLEHFCKDLHRYMRMLEDVVIKYLSYHNIEGYRREQKTGVWVDNNKLCAIGVSVSRWISWHGFALNIQPELAPFQELMTPCGISPQEGGVTSLAQLTGICYDMQEEAQKILTAFCEIFPYAVS